MAKRVIGALVIVVLLAMVGGLVEDRLFDGPSERPAAAPAVKPRPVRAIVMSMSGRVERHGERAGTWEAVQVGEAVRVREQIRTGRGGAAVLALGDNTRVEVDNESQFALGELTASLARVELTGGRLHARVTGGSSRLRVEVDGSDAVAEANEATFAVLRDPDAQVTVASESGEVAVSAQGKSVQVGAGEQSIVAKARPPGRPTAIPSSLFLKVTRREGRRLRRRATVVSGETAPGALVEVNGVRAAADAEGRFAAKVPLKEGRNTMTVSVRDALGRRKEQALTPVTVDTKPPRVRGEVVW